jgi:hypothetical protein
MNKKIKFVEPDYESGNSRSGGHVKDMWKPYIFMFPACKKPRKIDISIMTYAGCVGSNGHYYCSIKEEENMIWSWDEFNGNITWLWTKPWKSYEIRGITGRRWDGRFDNINVALKEIDKVLKSWKVSNKKKYKIVWNHEDNYRGGKPDYYRREYNKLLKGD